MSAVPLVTAETIRRFKFAPILTATVLTILVLPAGYALFFGREPKARTGAPEAASPQAQPDEDRETYPAPLAAE